MQSTHFNWQDLDDAKMNAKFEELFAMKTEIEEKSKRLGIFGGQASNRSFGSVSYLSLGSESARSALYDTDSTNRTNISTFTEYTNYYAKRRGPKKRFSENSLDDQSQKSFRFQYTNDKQLEKDRIERIRKGLIPEKYLNRSTQTVSFKALVPELVHVHKDKILKLMENTHVPKANFEDYVKKEIKQSRVKKITQHKILNTRGTQTRNFLIFQNKEEKKVLILLKNLTDITYLKQKANEYLKEVIIFLKPAFTKEGMRKFVEVTMQGMIVFGAWYLFSNNLYYCIRKALSSCSFQTPRTQSQWQLF
ncbi:uncharacterized protein LOC119670284 [Teleopsis dalmanni]|uniref:uncharacterized protein LOC119670284 n=1 Tax=Teleopsis dalmanni TaxID=139649 RepID=UPI0018CE04F6|nr:uncharacterized protein LOC119670284 [Teleopsis dalmanni]